MSKRIDPINAPISRRQLHAKHGYRLIMALTFMLVAAGCSASRDTTPTPATPTREVATERSVVVTPTEEPTATDLAPTPADDTTHPDAEVYALLESNQCLSCHMVGDRGNSLAGPSLNGLSERIDTYGLDQSAEEYVYEALVNPAAYLPDSCPNGQCVNMMPSYADRLSEDQLNAMVAFLLNLPAESD